MALTYILSCFPCVPVGWFKPLPNHFASPDATSLDHLKHLAELKDQSVSPFTEAHVRRLMHSESSSTRCASFTRLPSCLLACLGSRETRCAIVAGACLGFGSVAAGALPLSKAALVTIGGFLAASANASGTCLTLMDSINRDERQDILLDVSKLFMELSLCMIGGYLRADEAGKQEWKNLATQISENKEILRASIIRFVPEEVTLSLLMQAVCYIMDGKEPEDLTLRNEITTIDSPSKKEYEELKNLVLHLENRIKMIEGKQSKYIVNSPRAMLI